MKGVVWGLGVGLKTPQYFEIRNYQDSKIQERSRC
jgi:hypothetical protein